VSPPPHHGPLPSRIASQRRNHRPQQPSTDFCNKIGQKRTCGAVGCLNYVRGVEKRPIARVHRPNLICLRCSRCPGWWKAIEFRGILEPDLRELQVGRANFVCLRFACPFKTLLRHRTILGRRFHGRAPGRHRKGTPLIRWTAIPRHAKPAISKKPAVVCRVGRSLE